MLDWLNLLPNLAELWKKIVKREKTKAYLVFFSYNRIPHLNIKIGSKQVNLWADLKYFSCQNNETNV